MEVLDAVYEVYQDPYHSEPIHYCDLVDYTMTIRWNGDVVACCYDLTSRYVLGNVHQDDLATIWNSDKFLGLRRSIETGRFIPLCANCNVVKPNTFLLLRPEAVLGSGATSMLDR
jgi:radical SAM protein with 4Fe4S-binding SPASM domain